MTSAADALTELERDALTELVNIGVSRAASALRKMVGDQVLLSVPAVEIIGHKAAATVIGERESDDLVAVRQDFVGAFSGRALLIFPRVSSLELVRAVIGEANATQDAAGLEQEALAETGNIILNGCLSTLANMLQESLSVSLPRVLRGNGAQVFELEGQPPSDRLVLFFYINFWVRDRQIRGYIAVLMDLQSLESVKRLVNDFIARVMADDDTSGEPIIPTPPELRNET